MNIQKFNGKNNKMGKRCKDAHITTEKQALFGIIQGGFFKDFKR